MVHEEKIVKKAIGKYLDQDIEVINDQVLENDLGFDSLATVELVMEIEHQLNINLPDNFLHDQLGDDWKKATVQSWINAVREKQEGSGLLDHPHAENADHPFRGPYIGDNRYSVYKDVKNRLRVVRSFDLQDCKAALELDDLQDTVRDAINSRMRKLEG